MRNMPTHAMQYRPIPIMRSIVAAVIFLLSLWVIIRGLGILPSWTNGRELLYALASAGALIGGNLGLIAVAILLAQGKRDRD